MRKCLMQTIFCQCPGLCPVLFNSIFTRKGPDLCKILDFWNQGQGGDVMGQTRFLSRRHQAADATNNYLQIIILLTEHTVEISQIFSDKNHPDLEPHQRSTSNSAQSLFSRPNWPSDKTAST